jgi:hypothetical protein
MNTAIDGGCPSCGTALGGNYCSTCGQRAPRPGDFTWRRFATELWEEISGSDSRLLRTAIGIFRPGVLTLAFVRYRPREFLPPLRLYLGVSALFFLLAWGAYFQLQVMEIRSAPPGAMPEVLRAMYADPATAERLSDWTGAFRFIGVLALGGVVALLHRRARLPIGRHLVFATHYYCADYALNLLASPLLYLAPAQSFHAVTQALTFGVLAWLAWWAVVADRRVYGGRWSANVLRGLLIVVADVVITFVAAEFALFSVLLTRQ